MSDSPPWYQFLFFVKRRNNMISLFIGFRSGLLRLINWFTRSTASETDAGSLFKDIEPLTPGELTQCLEDPNMHTPGGRFTLM